jgi:hypothetical protein
MEKNTKRNIAIGTVAALALGGGGIAVAATQSTSRADKQKAFLEDAAKRLNVTPDQLSSALKGAFGDQLDEAVKAGRLTQKQADAMKQRIEKNGLPIGPGGGGPGEHGGRGFGGGHGGPGGPGGPFGAGLDAAADYLGLTEDQLREKLKDGKTTLADVAKAQGKTADGLEQAIVTAAKKQIEQAVTDGKLTRDRADEIEKKLSDRVDDIVTKAAPQRPDGPPGGGPDGARGYGRP